MPSSGSKRKSRIPLYALAALVLCCGALYGLGRGKSGPQPTRTFTSPPTHIPSPTATATPIPPRPSTPTSTMSPEAGASTIGIPVTVLVEPLTVYSGPGWNYAIIWTANRGDPIRAVARTQDGAWLKIARDHESGWTLAGNVQVAGDLTALPPLLPTETPIPPPTATPLLPTATSPPPIAAPPAAPPARTCCKICTTGKACGDSCIAKTKTCTQPPGCACNAQ